MNFKSVFSLAGRAGRKSFWIYGVLLPAVGVFVITFAMSFYIGFEHGAGRIDQEEMNGSIRVLTALVAVLYLFPFVPMAVKRMHDLGRSGWWVLAGFIPIVGIVMFVWQVFFNGVPGLNEYGADPLGGSAAWPSGLALVGTGGQYDRCEFPLEQTIVIGTDARRASVVVDPRKYPDIEPAHCEIRPPSGGRGPALYWPSDTGVFDRRDDAFDGRTVDLGGGLRFEVRQVSGG